MPKHTKTVYPYIPNSVPEVQQAMLDEIGVETFEDLITDIPEDVRSRAEGALKRMLEFVK